MPLAAEEVAGQGIVYQRAVEVRQQPDGVRVHGLATPLVMRRVTSRTRRRGRVRPVGVHSHT